MPWQSELLQQVQKYGRNQPSLKELWVFGSAAHPELLDRWSDVDLGLVLTADLDLDPLITSLGEIWTWDRSVEETGSTHRMIFADGRRLDLVVGDSVSISERGGRQVQLRPATCSENVPTSGNVTGSGNETMPRPEGGTVPRITISEPSVADDVLQARFLAGLAAVKLGRRDFLIGTHLTLEFVQLCLVQAMVLRDRDEGRTSHRFGTQRDDLAERILESSRRPVDADCLDSLLEIAQEFDRLRKEIDPTYSPDWSGLQALVSLSA